MRGIAPLLVLVACTATARRADTPAKESTSTEPPPAFWCTADFCFTSGERCEAFRDASPEATTPCEGRARAVCYETIIGLDCSSDMEGCNAQRSYVIEMDKTEADRKGARAIYPESACRERP